MAYRRRMQQDGGQSSPPPRARPPPQTSDSMGSSFDGTRQSVNRARAADRYQRQAGIRPAGEASAPLPAGEASAPLLAGEDVTEPKSFGDTEVGTSAAQAEPVPTNDVSNGLDSKLAAIFDGYAEPPELE